MLRFLCWIVAFVAIPSVCIGQVQDTVKVEEAVIWPHSPPHVEDELKLQDPIITSSSNLASGLAKSGLCFVKNYGASGIGTLGLRGLGAEQTKVTWNGININSPTLGLSNLSNLPTAAFDKVLVQSGMGQLDRGSGSLGGTINLDSDFSNQLPTLTLQASSLNNALASIKFSSQRGRLRSKLSVGGWLSRNDFDFEDPSTLDDERKESIHSKVLGGFAQLGLKYYSQRNSTTSFMAWIGTNQRQLPGTLLAPKEDSLVDSYTRFSVNHTIERKAFRHAITAGANIEQQDFYSDLEYRINTSSYQGGYEIDYAPSKKSTFEANADSRREQAHGEGLLENSIRWRNALGAGWKYLPSPTVLINLSVRQEQIADQWSPLQLSGTVKKDISDFFFALKLGNNFRAPTLNERFWKEGGNLDLKAENSQHVELAWGKEKTTGWYGFRQNFYFTQVQDYIRWVPEQGGVQVVNEESIIALGLESRMNAECIIGRMQLDIELQHHWNKVGRVTETRLGKQLTHVPEHRIGGSTQLTLMEWTLALNGHYTSKRFLNDQQSAWMPEYVLWHMALQKTISQSKVDWTINLGVDNIFNQSYQVMPWQPMPGRVFNLALKIQPKW